MAGEPETVVTSTDLLAQQHVHQHACMNSYVHGIGTCSRNIMCAYVYVFMFMYIRKYMYLFQGEREREREKKKKDKYRNK